LSKEGRNTKEIYFLGAFRVWGNIAKEIRTHYVEVYSKRRSPGQMTGFAIFDKVIEVIKTTVHRSMVRFQHNTGARVGDLKKVRA